MRPTVAAKADEMTQYALRLDVHNRGKVFDESEFSPIPGAIPPPNRLPVGTSPPRRAPFLTSERVQLRHTTLLDAFQTADRRQRGHLPYDRVLSLYGLYFHASIGALDDNEFADFAEQFMFHTPFDGTLVVEYHKLADALRKRDIDLMNKAAIGALRQGGLNYASPERQVYPQRTGPSPAQVSPPYGTYKGTVGPPSQPYPSQPYPSQQPRAPMYQELPQYQPPLHDAFEGMSTGRPPVAHLSPKHGSSGGYAPAPLGAFDPGGREWAGSANGLATPPMRRLGRGVGSGDESQTRPGDSLRDLLQTLEAADAERSYRVHSAQLLTCCRMKGLEEPSSLLHSVMREVATEDGRVDYVKFTQQLAAQRAGEMARAALMALPG